MLIVQPILIARKKYALHRRLGKGSYLLFGLLILSFVPQIIKVIKRESDYRVLFFPLADIALLITFFVLAMINKRNITRHMRYIIAGALVFLGPTLGRMGPLLFGWGDFFTQNILYAIVYTILICLLVYDQKKLKRNPAYLVAMGMFFLHQMTFYYLFA
jgi:hypothetical protein